MRAVLISVVLGLAASVAVAQTAPPPGAVEGPEISMLIRTTMIALDQANATGNYTVLRDLGAAILRTSNSDADLAELFVQFRKNRMSLAATVLVDAILDQKPELSTNGVLHLVGHFPTTPQEVIFDMTFAWESGAWRIALLRVGTRLAPGTEALAAKPNAPADPVPTPRLKPKP
jgi:hypothetical protein